MNTPIIEVRNLSKTFVLHQQGGVAIEALSGISFSVDAGECVALHRRITGINKVARIIDNGHLHRGRTRVYP